VIDLLSGNQALARGAWEAGVRVAAGYPGTPSTEVLETLASMDGVYTEWSPNEKVALDVAIGAAYAGRRSLAVMKHVGLNVAADSLFYVCMTGMQAGLVIIVADDPGLHSSQGEQDSRRYCKFARLPCLEPSDSQEAKSMVGLAFDLSERFDTPVMVRSGTRISHSFGLVEMCARVCCEDDDDADPFVRNPQKYVMVPGVARRRHPIMEERMEAITAFADALGVNRIERRSSALGVVTHGIAYQYVREVLPEASILRLGMSYPVAAERVRSLAADVDRLLVVEELDPVIEEEIRLLGVACEGKSLFPISGELSPQSVREGCVKAGLVPAQADGMVAEAAASAALPMRPPALCPGCPHRGVYYAIHQLDLAVNGDIGCYALGFMPPLSAVHSIGCMGAGVGQAHGVAAAAIGERSVAVIGDSTFFHSGMPALLNAVYNRQAVTVVVLDNRTTAMTGHQENPGSGSTLMGETTVEADIGDIARALGVRHVETVDPYDLGVVESALRDAVGRDEASVVVARRACALSPEARASRLPLAVDAGMCVACGQCLQLGCPALFSNASVLASNGRETTRIDALLCSGCGMCAQVCPVDAIRPGGEDSQ